VQYAVAPDDFERLKSGMKLVGRIAFAAGGVAVYPSTFSSRAILRESDIDAVIDAIRNPEDVSLTSAHPQGGNPMSDDPGLGVVDTGFRVHGFDNLYVCDASVFPTSVRVNPQLTVMAMAEYAAGRIAPGYHT
jgi:choline dehydrogenase-like flavoprotein